MGSSRNEEIIYDKEAEQVAIFGSSRPSSTSQRIASQYNNTSHLPSVPTRTNSTASTASTASGYSASTVPSRSYSISSSISSSSSRDSVDVQQGPLPPNTYGYTLPCLFSFIECGLEFHPLEVDAWIAHSASHFGSEAPPSQTVCAFCDGDNGRFETIARERPRRWAWRERMLHIRTHLVNLEPPESMRPDFFVIQYMWDKRLITQKDYTDLMSYTERPGCSDTLPLGSKIPKMIMDEERSTRQPHDLERERRQQKREKRDKEKIKETHGPSKHTEKIS